MKLLYTKSKWEMPRATLEEFLQRSGRDGFDGVELYLPDIKEPAREIKARVEDHGLVLVAQITTQGKTPDEHIECIRRRFAFAAETQPLLVNSHTGRDIFSFADNCRIFEAACDLSEQYRLPFVQETHRSRPTYSVIETRRYLDAVPRMLLTADFSHWFCTHETDLSDQHENLDAAIARSHHIHARVGHFQGPQVPDPEAPEWWDFTEKFLSLWQRIIDTRCRTGAEVLSITPEFGPPPYMPCVPFTKEPLRDAWAVNASFLNILKQHLSIP